MSLSESEEKVAALESFKSWASLEETFWRQKSREIWIKEVDRRNTGFFHRMASSHKRRSHISKLRINGTWISEESDLKTNIIKAFESLMSDSREWKASIKGLTFARINEGEASNLERPFTEEEVFLALSDLNGDKALGPNGFTIAFWQFS